VHARLVLVHLTNRDEALERMINSLRPGGWLLIEDADVALQPLACIDSTDANHQLANKIRHGSRVLLKERGVDLEYGRKLPRLLRNAGLIDVCADAYLPISAPACALLETASINHIRDKLIAEGIATAEEIALNLSNIADGKVELGTSPLISAWGKRV